MIPQIEYELKSNIRKAGFTQKEIAIQLNVTYSTLSSWLNGFAPLPVQMKMKIHDIIADSEKNFLDQGGCKV